MYYVVNAGLLTIICLDEFNQVRVPGRSWLATNNVSFQERMRTFANSSRDHDLCRASSNVDLRITTMSVLGDGRQGGGASRGSLCGERTER